MAEYIEREKVLKAVCSCCAGNVDIDDDEPCCCAEMEEILNIPIADVVEVVRCKDCIHYKDEWCEILKAETPIADGFCCYGERKCDNG